MPKANMPFGEWLKIRRLAAELTPVDVARAIGMDAATYRELEAGRGGLTETQIGLLLKIERMRIGRRDIDHAGPVILPEDGTPVEAAPAAPAPAARASHLDALIASVQAKQERQATAQATAQKKARSALGTWLAEQAAAQGLSRMALARACRLGLADLDDIDAGFVPGPAGLKAIAAGLGVEPETVSALVQA